MPIGNWLKGVHNVSIATVKGQVVPSPISHRADLVSTTQYVEQVKPEPS
jgi:hypothetical protein